MRNDDAPRRRTVRRLTGDEPLGPSTARLSFFDARGIEPVRYAELADAVRDARRRNDELAG